MNRRTDEEMKWKVLESETLFERPWLNVRRDRTLLPTGKINEEFYVMHYPTWVNIIALTKDGQMILERQYRHGLSCVSTEIPAGVMEKGETPLEAAKRELQEETGYTGGTWTELMTAAPNPSTQDNVNHSFVARDVELTSDRHLDATEDIDVMLVPLSEVFKMLQRGEFIQALMIAPLWRFFYENNK